MKIYPVLIHYDVEPNSLHDRNNIYESTMYLPKSTSNSFYN